MDTKWVIILNPNAANGKAGKKWEQIKEGILAALPIGEVVFTAYAKHAYELVEQAIQEGYRKIIAAGGDGTHNEVVNGIFQQQFVDIKELTYALLPIGTGNDWIRTHGISRKVDEWIDMMKKAHHIWHDIGIATLPKANEKRYFINIAGMAYDAFVVKYMERYRKWMPHPIFYRLMILWCLFKYRLENIELKFNQIHLKTYFYTINIGLCRFSGGGMEICPHATPTDNQLALTYAKRLSKLAVIFNTYRFFNGTIGELKAVDLVQAKEVTIDTRGVGVEVDGEYIGESPVQFQILPSALKLIVTSYNPFV